ncbi:hypothetical protein HGA91_01980 [candidate division WWE3 bacterium]|nr:hypothetical protein [candidate division WWE3 bacterium]
MEVRFLDTFDPHDEAQFLTQHLTQVGIDAGVLGLLERVNRLTIEGLTPSEVVRLSAALAEAGIAVEQQTLIEPARQEAIAEMSGVARQIAQYSMLPAYPRRMALRRIDDLDTRSKVERWSDNQRDAAARQHGGVLGKMLAGLSPSTSVSIESYTEGNLYKVQVGPEEPQAPPPPPTIGAYFTNVPQSRWIRSAADYGSAREPVTKLLQARNMHFDRSIHCWKAQPQGCTAAAGTAIWVHGAITSSSFNGSTGLTVYYVGGQDIQDVDPYGCDLVWKTEADMIAALQAALK